jgi:hypothetical protein
MDRETELIGEYLMTENIQGEGFTKIEKSSSSISDLLKDLDINMLNRNINEIFQPLGETGYFL